MQIKITEKEICDVVQDVVNKYLDNNEINEDRIVVNEGLTCTYSIGKIKGILFRKYDFKKLGIVWGEIDMNKNSSNIFAPLTGQYKKTEDTDNWYFFTLEFKYGIKDNQNIVEDIIHTCDACGWYLADGRYYLRNGLRQEIKLKNRDTINFNDEKLLNNALVLTFRAKFNAEYKYSSVPRFLYHIAPLRVLKKIQKQGLTPRNNGRISSHPERVYLFLNYPHNWHEIANNFRNSHKDEKYALLEIDKAKINKKTKFYYDSNVMAYNPAIYTYEPIPSDAIKVVEVEKNE